MSDLFDLDKSESSQPRLRMEHSGSHEEQRAASTAYHPQDDGARDREFHLLDYARVLYKRRGTALTAFVIVMLSVGVYTLTATPIYEGRVQVLIEKELTNVVDFKQVFEQNQITDDYYQTQYKILQSRTLARQTIDALKLWDHPAFSAKSDNSFSLRKVIAAPGIWLAGWFKRSEPSEHPQADETNAQSNTIDRFLSQLTVAPIRNSRLVDIRFRSPDAAMAANVANALAKEYIGQNLEFKFVSSKEASDWLGKQLDEQRKQVNASEQALQRYREQTDSVSLEERQNIVVQKLGDLNAAVTRAKTERIQKEAAYSQIRTLQNNRTALDTLPAIVSNTFVQQLKSELAGLQRQQAQLSEKLGPRHPDMAKLALAIQNAEAKIQGEIGKVVQSMRNDYQQTLAQEQSLTEALEQQKRDALALNRTGIEYGALARDAASNRQIFESLMQRAKETGISGDLKTSNIRIVDAAETPRRPAAPNTANNLLLGLFGGATLAIGLAFFFEYLDDRIKNPDEMKQHLGLPFLGMVPALFDKGIVNPLVNNGVPVDFAESFRAVRTNLMFSSAVDGARNLMVTSTGPSEGKTVVATNLAISLAQTGQRVLLIDADMRKPRVHSVFGTSQQPGLSNLLVGTAKASESVHKTAVTGLWVMPSGAYPPNPAELLGSKRFKEFIGSLGQHFDWVVVDTPPVMVVTDAAVVAHLIAGVVFVVGADMTSRNAARHAVEQLDHARATFLGAVLNRVDLKHDAYYYSRYYRREYSDHYHKSAHT
jgi:capsular exopolysaccharide synthesis family protein